MRRLGSSSCFLMCAKAALVVAVAYFAAAWLGKKVKLDAHAKHVAKVSRKMFEVPSSSTMR